MYYQRLLVQHDYEELKMTIFTTGRSSSSDNLQTTLPIEIPNSPFYITFKDVITSDVNSNEQPYEQFKIVALNNNDSVLGQTGYTTDINNATLEEESSDLGSIFLASDTDRLVLVHRVDPVYGDIYSDEGNSVTFKSLCYKIETTNP